MHLNSENIGEKDNIHGHKKLDRCLEEIVPLTGRRKKQPELICARW